MRDNLNQCTYFLIREIIIEKKIACVQYLKTPKTHDTP